MVVRPAAKSLAVSQGKGLTDELAVASGAMESIELFHAEEAARLSCGEISVADAMRSAEFLAPTDFLMRANWCADPRQTYRYAEAARIDGSGAAYLPLDLVDLDFTAGRQLDEIFFSSSNGLASGNTLDEALLHGFCEVIERDQTTFWLAAQAADPNEQLRSLVRNDSIDDPAARAVLEQCEAAGLTVLVWYASVTIGLPVFVCQTVDLHGRTPYPQRASGFGCHPVKSIALTRALTEALQSRLTHISGARDDASWSKYRHDLPASGFAASAWAQSLVQDAAPVDYRAIAGGQPGTIRAMLADAMALAAADGLDSAYFVDLTRDDIGIPVATVIVPGAEFCLRKAEALPGRRLQSFAARYAA